MAQSSRKWPRPNKRTTRNLAFSTAANTSTTTNTKWQQSKQVSIPSCRMEDDKFVLWLRCGIGVPCTYEPPLFIVLKQSAGGQAAAPAGAYMAQNRQYVMPQQAGATPAQLGLAASMAAAPALQQWLAANSAPSAPSHPHHHELDTFNAQINMLKEQITQSENNLNAQHTVSLWILFWYCALYNL